MDRYVVYPTMLGNCRLIGKLNYFMITIQQMLYKLKVLQYIKRMQKEELGMKVEVWSDFVCPFCYIGKRRLEQALEQFEHGSEVEVSYRSFQLQPDAKKNTGLTMHQVLAAKLGVPYEQAKAMNAQVAEQAKQVGLDYQMDTMIPTNTFDAHRLAYYAKDQGKMKEFTERVLKAYFTDSLDISDHATLARLAEEVGLDANAALDVLSSEQYSQVIALDRAEANAIGIRGVPFFVVDDKYAISGAQPNQVFLETLSQAWAEAHPKFIEVTSSESGGDGGYCADGVCEVPLAGEPQDR